MKAYTFGVVATLLNAISAAPAADKVVGLPGMNDTFSYDVYSGFLNLTETKRIYYLFEGSRSVNASTDPIILWSNGGPGCSSLLGWLSEVGTYMQNDDGSFVENPHSWNQFANILYLDHPAPVGFSTCNPNSNECHANDTSDGQDNLAAIRKFFEAFPEHKNKELWLSGESYAGIYIPYLLWNIDTFNNLNETLPEDKINLKGMMVGNGVTNWTYDTQPATFNMTYWHALMGQEMWDDLNDNQCDFSLMNFGKLPGPKCLALYERFQNITAKINMYKIFDPYMVAPTLTRTKQVKSYTSGDQLFEITDDVEEEYRGFSHRHYTPWMVGPFKESKSYYSALRGPAEFLNNATVRTALHIPDGHQTYMECNDGTLGFTYIMEERASQFIWEAMKGRYQMMKYSGNIDAVVPTDGTLGWINSLNRTVVTEWRQFNVSDWNETTNPNPQVGGWIENYEDLTFVSINGAGHMVPADRPDAIGYVVKHFINNQTIAPPISA